MKNRFYITITDFRGVKCYSFDKIIKKYLFVVGSLFFTGLVLLIIMIFVLKEKVDEYSYFNCLLYTSSMHGAGSPQAQRIMISRQSNLEVKKQLVKDILDIKD